MMTIPDFLAYQPTGYDICLCHGGGCPHRALCLRYLAEPGNRQDAFGTPPVDQEGNCTEFRDAREPFRQALRHSAIEYEAYLLATQGATYADCLWRLAQTDLRLEQLYDSPAATAPLAEHEIRDCAYSSWQVCMIPIHELHWIMAERQLVLRALRLAAGATDA
ncbi:hypothetical protein [uncultured Thiodictyon sp.]|uniref:hypothetical protein n=1 Tax=uncultured Thiodictyon sp. TaxID=1846217 RepID=UPI0025DC69D3|nr:hypothetical protein [uncultured Thiodictyon sp.]